MVPDLLNKNRELEIQMSFLLTQQVEPRPSAIQHMGKVTGQEPGDQGLS